uniref:Uncharacterized protein n=1 Tax=Anguilla anguilla TaxID=7936 RepID=A0A0E9UIR7_ANGAN
MSGFLKGCRICLRSTWK